MKERRLVFRLGHRAFFLFLSRRVRPVLILFLIAGAVWFAGMRWTPAAYVQIVDYVAEGILLISIAYLCMMLLRTWLEYRAYTYAFTEEAFVVTNGYLTRTEMATLYHQIQTVNIERTFFDRLNGVSSLVIILAGGQHESHNKIMLPAVARARAREVQKELLVRARHHASGGTVAEAAVAQPSVR